MGKAESALTPQRTDTGNASYSQVSHEERKDAANSIRRNKISRPWSQEREFTLNSD